MPIQYPLVESASESNRLIKVLVGPAASSQPYLLPKQQICFYSPYLRSLLERSPSHCLQMVCLPDDNAAAFEVLVAWMASCHQCGTAWEDEIKLVDRTGVPLAFKVWTLTHRLGGPCLVLRDECMRYLYGTYAMSSPGTRPSKITPAIFEHAFGEAKDNGELRHFVAACLVRDGPPDQSNTTLARDWEAVLNQMPVLGAVVQKAWGGSKKERSEVLLDMEVYMSAPGEIFGDVMAPSSGAA